MKARKTNRVCLVCGRLEANAVTLPSGLPATVCPTCMGNHFMVAEAERRAVKR